MRRLVLIISALLLLLSSLSVSAQYGQIVHIVQPGETLYRISLRYNTSIGAIAYANGIYNVNHIFAGQYLIIPSPYYPPPPTHVPPPTVSIGDYYTVRRGDTLALIARYFNTTTSAIAAANGIVNINRIFPGQVLLIPRPAPDRIATYIVVRGDNLTAIAARFGTSVQAIISYNGLVNANAIYPGQLLYIPY